MRRKFYGLADKSPVATEVLRRIAMLDAIEDEVRGISAEQSRAVRAKRARVIADDLRVHLEARLRQVSAKSKLADAIRYALSCLGRAVAVRRRRSRRAGFQHRRAIDPTPDPQSQERAL